MVSNNIYSLSTLGTFTSPTLGSFLTSNPLPYGKPWGLLTASGSNPYTAAPNTGVIRSYNFTLARGTLAPDGYQKSMILINGQFPGPTIEANWYVPPIWALWSWSPFGYWSFLGGTQSRWPWIMRLLDLKRGRRCIGMASCKRHLPGWTAFQPCNNVLSPQSHLSPIHFKQICKAFVSKLLLLCWPSQIRVVLVSLTLLCSIC